jgi:hypothetical protein
LQKKKKKKPKPGSLKIMVSFVGGVQSSNHKRREAGPKDSRRTPLMGGVGERLPW